ncbi:MAG: glycosyltransferase [Bacteroidales bacterium]|nr:glycosyltransferase [Bacteroidales bacterium]
MKILFILRIEVIPEIGGVERVTYALSDYFRKEGIEISYLYYSIKSTTSTQSHHGIKTYFLPNQENIGSIENQAYISRIIKDNSIDIVINQDGMTGSVSELLRKGLRKTDSKLISTLHRMPHGYKLYRKLFINILKASPSSINVCIKKLIATPLSFVFYHKRYLKYSKLSIKYSHSLVVLSESYIDLMRKILKANKNNIIAIPNPLPFDVTLNRLDLSNKKRQVLFVGRLEYSAKRIDRLIRAWEMIEKEVSDWKLVIVGGDGGDEKEIAQREEFYRLKNLAQSLHLQNVEFVGRQDPQPYYRDSQIFCMTSSYEGFGMVLIEAMQFGVVPMAFGSYPAVFDIIKHEVNGLIIDPFNIEEYANNLKMLICDEEKRRNMAREAIISSKKFSVENIGKQWIELFNELKSQKYDEINK